MGLAILWIVAVVFGMLAVYLLAIVLVIAFKRFFPHQVATVERATLGEWRVPKSEQAYLTVTYSVGGKTEQLRLLFWSANRQRIERSRRYRKLLSFFAPSQQFRLYALPMGAASGPIPETPVVRVETMLVTLGLFVSACIAFGAIAALMQ